ncbi:MAG: S1 family peptidase [Actinomycetota bacterium]|nr:S1 family peptidase [Actinomycetota bacterium]
MTTVDLTTAQIAPDFTEGLVQAKQEKEADLLALDNVVGVGLGYKVTDGVVSNERCIQVFVEHKVDLDLLPTGERIPKTVNRRPTDVVAVGNLFAWNWGTAAAAPGIQTLTGKRRPAMGGDSIGHFAITAGTAGTGCYDRSVDPGIPPRYYILSNNHVLANSNDANLGDAIYQPGPHDGGGPADQIGALHHYVPIKFDGSDNLVDAAVAEVPFHDFTREIYYLGYVAGNYAPVVVGDLVKKTGRTTNFTTGRVISVAATVNVNYGGGKVAKFVNQIITTAMSAGGDSGSLVLDTDNNAVGMLFAGSSVVTIINNIQFVQALLNVRLTED